MKNKTQLSILFMLFISLFVNRLQAQLLTTEKELPCLNKTFQVHAHVVLDSFGIANYTADDLAADLELANEYFAPICIDFKLCSVDTIENYEYDVIEDDLRLRELSEVFQIANRINFYLLSFVKEESTCGLANVGGVSGRNSGAVYLKCRGITIVHELGHLFGLKHTFEGNGIELVDGSNCETEGDGICDTPADPYVEGEDFSLYLDDDCRFINEKVDANQEYYQPDVANIMSYYPCRCGFTRGQYLKMVETYNNSNFKLW